MRRRTFLAGLGFAALQLAGCSAKPQTTPDYVLTYADNQPAGTHYAGAQYFADLVQQQTGGKVVIQVKANGEYGSEQQVWEQLAIGGVDFARVSLSVATTICPGSTCCCCRISTGMPTICGVCWTAASGQSFCRTLPHRGAWA